MRFVPSRFQIFVTYSLGYGIPLIIVGATLATSILSENSHYVREYFDEDANSEEIICWLDVDSIIWALMIPVSLMILFNLGVVLLIVNVAYHASFNHNKLVQRF